MHVLTRRLAGALATGAALTATALASAGPAHAAPAHAAAAPKPSAALPMSVFTGTVQPGDTRAYVFNNAGTDRVFTVGLNPTGATTTTNCQFEVTRKWDVQQPGGEREFHFVLKNVGTIACGTTAQVASVAYTHNVSLGAVDVGASVTWGFNTSNEDIAYFGGVDPVGATSSTPCQFQVTAERYLRTTDGVRQFHVTAKNVGDIACQAVGLIGDVDENTESGIDVLQPGDTTGFIWANTKANLQYTPGINEALSLGDGDCKYQITRMWYQQRIRDDGTASRDLRLQIKNVGTVPCFGVVVQIAAIDTSG